MSKKKMKILYVLEHYHPYIGGSEKLFQGVAEGMVQKGHKVQVITTRYDPGLPAEELHNGVLIKRIPASNRFLFTLQAIPFVIKAARKFDIIHTTTYNAAVPAWIGAKWTGTTAVLTFHEVWDRLWFTLPFARWWERILFYSFEKLVTKLSFDHYIAVSKYTEESLIHAGIPANKISQVYNGIDYNELEQYSYRPDPRPPFNLVYFGRLGISKGIDIIIKGLSLLKNELPIELVLITPKHPSHIWRSINDLIDKEEVRPFISFKHELSREELMDTVRKCHAALVPSHSEGFCFTAVEAAALGIPVLHSGKGALKEVIDQGQDWVIELSPEDLAQKVRHLAELSIDQPIRNLRIWPIKQSIEQTMNTYERAKKKEV